MIKKNIIWLSVFAVLVMSILLYSGLFRSHRPAGIPFTAPNVLPTLSPEAFKDVILSEISGLSEAISDNDHLKTTTLLREYVYKHTIWSNDGLNSEKYFKTTLSPLTAPQISALLNTREIGVRCGGTAIFLDKIYKLFGYQSGYYNYGLPGVSTHVTTLVCIPNKDRTEVVIQDATFNSSLAISKRENRDFFDIMDALKAGRGHEIILLAGTSEPRTICFSDNAAGLKVLKQYQSSNILLEEPVLTTSLITHTPILCARGDLDFYSSYLRRNKTNILNALSEKLNKNVNECSVFELMLFPLSKLPFNRDMSQSKN